MDSQTSMNQNTMWYIIGAVAIVALIIWYVSSQTAPAPATTTTPTASTNSTAAIASDFNQTTDGSAELNQDAAAAAQAVSSF